MPPTAHRHVNGKPLKIGINWRKFVPFHPLDLQKTVFFQRVCYAENKTVHIDWLSFPAALSKQGSNAVEHITGTMPVALYAGQGCTCSVMIRWRPSKPQQCCIGVCHDGA